MDARRTTPFYHNETDEFLHRKIEIESERAKKAESELSQFGNDEREARQKADAELQASLDAETERAEEAEASIREDYLNRKTGGQVSGPIVSSSYIDADVLTAKGRLNVDGAIQHSGTEYLFPEGASAEETIATEAWAS